MPGTWKVSVQGKDMRGTASLEWRAEGTAATAPPDFALHREGEFTSESLAALLPIAYAMRDDYMHRETVKQSVAQQIEDALNASDPGVQPVGGA